jgi:hypothetical protein
MSPTQCFLILVRTAAADFGDIGEIEDPNTINQVMEDPEWHYERFEADRRTRRIRILARQK